MNTKAALQLCDATRTTTAPASQQGASLPHLNLIINHHDRILPNHSSWQLTLPTYRRDAQPLRILPTT